MTSIVDAFIWGKGGKKLSPEDVAREREIAAMAAQRAGDTSPVGHWSAGAARIVDALGGKMHGARADRAEAAGLASAESQMSPIISALSSGTAMPQMRGDVIAAQSDPWVSERYGPVMRSLLSALPKYKLGTNYHPGGPAIVGENGPEIAWLPEGASVTPNPTTLFAPQGMEREFDALTPEEKALYIKRLNEGLSPEEAIQPEGYDPRQMLMEQGALQQPYRVADSGQVKSDAYPISPAGVGDESDINRAAYAYRTFNNALDDYNGIVKSGGVSIIPGVQKDAIDVARRNLQMQMKELYNLGVLNGPDLDLMNQIIVDPTGIGNKALDVLGIADTEERVAKNIEQVRGIMRQLVEPKLKAIGATPEQVYSPTQMSDEEYLRALGLN